jgi:hypothetical protein
MIDASYELARIARLEEALRKANEEIGALGANLQRERLARGRAEERLVVAHEAIRELQLMIDRNMLGEVGQ